MPGIQISEPVGHRRLKNQLPQVLRETVHQGLIAPVSNNGTVDAYLVSIEDMEKISLSERLQDAIPLLMSAVSAGAAIPSQTLKSLGLEIPFDWKKLNEFTSSSEIRFSMGEDGEPWVEAPTVQPQIIEESDVEIDL